MDRCQAKYGFPFPAIHSRFASDKVSAETVDEILNLNNINIRGGNMVTRALIKSLFELKTAIEKIVGENYYVEVFYSIKMMDEFNYFKHCFELCSHGNLIKVDITEWTVVIKLRSSDCDRATYKIYDIYKNIYKNLKKNYKFLLEQCEAFARKTFPKCPSNTCFYENCYQCYLE